VVGGDALNDRSDAGVTPVEPVSTPTAEAPAYTTSPPERPEPPEAPDPPEAPEPPESPASAFERPQAPEDEPAPAPEQALASVPAAPPAPEAAETPRPAPEAFWHKPEPEELAEVHDTAWRYEPADDGQVYGDPYPEPAGGEPFGDEPLGDEAHEAHEADEAGPEQRIEPVVEPVLTLVDVPPPPPLQQPSTPSERTSLITDACPYLRSADGLWRSAVSERDLRCWGSAPPLPLTPETQDRLCRTPSHVRCEIFLGAQQARVTALAADHVSPEQLDGRFGLLVRPTPLILDRPVSLAAALPSRKPRTLAGIAVAGLAALVLAIVLVALLQGGGTGPQSTPTPLVAVGGSPSPAAGSGAVASSAETPSPSASDTLPASLAPETLPPSPSEATKTFRPPASLGPGESLPAGVARTYRVHKGDTLAAIAEKFGVTAKAIRDVNDLGDPPRLFFGQIINIPAP
jgi:LysM repeat protein